MAHRTLRNAPPASPPSNYHAMMREVDGLPIPQKTANERAASARLSQRMRDMVDELRARNLANGLALAQQAAKHQGQLVDVFAELGRRYSHLLDETGGRTVLTEDGLVKLPARKPKRATLRLIEGGAD